jgi:transcription elongation factor GreA
MSEFIVTKEVLEKMKEELAILEGEKRNEIKKRISIAREEGDLKENGGYHAAREAQGLNEAKIKELSEKIRNSKIKKTSNKKTDKVEELTIVKIKTGMLESEFLVGEREMASSSDYKTLSITTPLGNAIIGKKTGDEVKYKTPKGMLLKAKILSIRAM